MDRVEQSLPDIQNREDERGIAIERVGITNVYFPIKVKTKEGGYVPVSARVKLFVGLPKVNRGANLSRFYETLVEFSNHTMSSEAMPKLLELLQKNMKSYDAYARFEFDYFIDRKAPVSKKEAPQRYRCAFTGVRRNGEYEFILEVRVIATSLCPCSKSMSLLSNLTEGSLGVECGELVSEQFSLIKDKVGMGAHNQRSNIRVEVVFKADQRIWIEDLIELVEEQASAPVYPILKRPDEKFVTEKAYNNPKFSEDIIRDIQLALEKLVTVKEWAIRVSNEESVHSYDVTCYQQSKEWKH